MHNTRTLIYKFISTFLLALLTLGLFDTNPLIMVLVYALIVTFINGYIQQTLLYSAGKGLNAIVQGAIAGGVVWVMVWLFQNFRATLATWIAFVMLLSVCEYHLQYYIKGTSWK